jgi:aminoglycoside phosphotransferase (APT) family kinase protein
MPALDTDALAAALERELGPVEIIGCGRLSGGASRETWAFDARTRDGTVHPLVLRRDPSAHVGQSDRTTEYELLRAAAAAGVPVPELRLLLDPDDGLGAGFVMARIDGETIPRRILRDDEYAGARRVLSAQCAAILARIHAVDRATLPELPVLTAARQVEQYRELLDAFGQPHPAFELALRHLADHAPPAGPPALVHGDFRNGNLIVGPEGVRAVLDWELAHLGDPVEDLGWLCVKSWRFGANERVVGGFGEVTELLAAYRHASGVTVDVDRLRYWVVFGTLKWGIICIGQAFTHLDGLVRSVELATLGRRVAETEWDLLELLEGGW